MSTPRATARVDAAAIRHNVAELRSRVASGQLLAVVKADGYGHGLLTAATAAVAGGAQWLGTALLQEALELRAAGLTQPRVVAWLLDPDDDWDAALRGDIDLSANDAATVAAVAGAAARTGRPARLHLKIDTGLGRAGSPADRWAELVDAALRAQAEGVLEVVGLWSHLAYADAPHHPTTDHQIEAFRAAVDTAERAGARPEVRHLANSAATLTRPDAHFDLVRPGLAVYGLSPIPDQADSSTLGLRPALTLTARLGLVKRVPAGQGVSYLHRYTTKRPTTLGLVPLGYADGVPRNATNVGPVLAAGARRTIAGTVCMDQFVLDLGDDPAQAGDEVVLFGPGDDGEPTAEDWARATGTISYEIVTRLGPRLSRVVVGADGIAG
ncbi:MAG TPA: alanine racemase [Actinomycetes bacterium]